MIDPRRNKILVRDRVRNKNESASVYAVWAIRAWIKGKVRLNERTHSDHRPVCQLAITGVIRGRGDKASNPQPLPQTFVICKEECMVLDNRPRGRSAELVAFK